MRWRRDVPAGLEVLSALARSRRGPPPAGLAARGANAGGWRLRMGASRPDIWRCRGRVTGPRAARWPPGHCAPPLPSRTATCRRAAVWRTARSCACFSPYRIRLPVPVYNAALRGRSFSPPPSRPLHPEMALTAPLSFRLILYALRTLSLSPFRSSPCVVFGSSCPPSAAFVSSSLALAGCRRPGGSGVLPRRRAGGMIPPSRATRSAHGRSSGRALLVWRSRPRRRLRSPAGGRRSQRRQVRPPCLRPAAAAGGVGRRSASREPGWQIAPSNSSTN